MALFDLKQGAKGGENYQSRLSYDRRHCGSRGKCDFGALDAFWRECRNTSSRVR